MSSPRVSVCIVTCNHELYIHECIMSVISQACDFSLEILIGDDLSSDRTPAIVHVLEKKFPEIIRYFRHESKQGASGNYQFLIENAKGEYIAHLDGDDYWLPGKLAIQVALLDRFCDVSASYTNALCIDGSGRAIGVFSNEQPQEFEINYLFKRGNFLNNSSMLYRAYLGAEILRWRSEFLDYKIHLMLAAHGKVGFVNSLGVVYRVNSSASMILHSGERVRELYWQAICEVQSDLLRKKNKIYASADFLRRIIFRSLKIRSFILLKKWWLTVSNMHAGQIPMLIFLVICNVLSILFRELMSRFAAKFGGGGLRVMYWR